MTRAALLHVLDNATAIAPAEVRELEQLAQAFPYCQTAHLLLAKAAHDQGTMLAGQRLRRAATYAADRELLRRLIEQVVPEATPPDEPSALGINEEDPSLHPAPETAPITESAEAPGVPVALPEAPVVVVPEPVQAVSADVVTTEHFAVEAEATTLLDGAAVTPVEEEPAAMAPADAADIQVPTSEAAPTVEAPATNEASENHVDASAGALLPLVANGSAESLLSGPIEPELPAAVPPIRPPEDSGAARLEFGLHEAPAVAAGPIYDLPGLVDEWAAAATTMALGAPEPVAGRPAAIHPALSATAFTGDAALGYGLSGGSRLGFALQCVNSWETGDQAAEASGPTTPLPPTGEFFAPDALLLDHWMAHRPPDLPTPGDLINNFLRRQPRLSRPAMLPAVTAGAQADLSARSNRPQVELASEGLAQILVRQGKTTRAIEIYERLMVRQPEKMAYFAAQIQQLQPPAQ